MRVRIIADSKDNKDLDVLHEVFALVNCHCRELSERAECGGRQGAATLEKEIRAISGVCPNTLKVVVTHGDKTVDVALYFGVWAIEMLERTTCLQNRIPE